MDQYQEYVALSRYARWRPEDGRRETWEETVDRYVDYFGDELGKSKKEVKEAIVNLEVMPSMRCLMTAGEALDRDHVAGYNCSYLPIDHPRAFDEMMYILMCGTGVGFSVERQYVQKLPDVAETFHDTDTVLVVADSKIGWAKAFRELVSLLYSGQVPKWDVSKVRPAGAKLKTFGGRASGPEPLVDLFEFTVNLFRHAAGRRLTSLECHDLACKVAEVVVVGGVRRSALISLSNPSDDRLRRAKNGEWWYVEPQRALANNSACYTEKPDFESFTNEWVSLYESKSGERGIFSRTASQKQAESNGRRDSSYAFGTNPCSEIILRPNQFCNLSEVVARPGDTLDDLKRKVRLATICGTIQATKTNFRYLRKIWQNNTEEERLLGVSITGIMDHPVLNGSTLGNKGSWFNHPNTVESLEKVLEELRDVAIQTNKEWAKKLGIEQSTAITCVKPSGTVSQLVDSASGIHPRYAHHYIRRIRADVKDPLAQLMIDQGVPHEVQHDNPNVIVFSFPKKAPANAVTTSATGAMEQLRLWSIYQKHWCEHKPSITVYYTDEDFFEVGQWVYNNFESVSGVSFLPYSDHTYKQAPYEEVDEETYNKLLEEFPDHIDWSKLVDYEVDDQTEGTQELACTGGACEL